MKIKRIQKIIFLAVMFILLISPLCFGAAVLSLVPESYAVTNNDFSIVQNGGDTVNFDIFFNLPSTEYAADDGLYGATFYVDFDPAIVTVTGASFNTDLWDTSEGSKVTINQSEGNIEYGLLDSYDGSGPLDSFKLGSFSIQLASIFDITFLTTREFSPGDNYDFPLWSFDSLDDEITFKGGQISAVPIPGALLLFGSGLIGIVGVRKKLRKS